jgi:hypothetical protein
LSVDNNCRQRGSDENDSPLLLERDDAAEEGNVVTEGKQGDQAEGDGAEHLENAEEIEALTAAGW